MLKLVSAFLALCAVAASAGPGVAADLTNEQMENLVRQSYRFVAMFNVNNKFAMDENNPMNTGGWNRVKANTMLTDHTMRAIARPNNDTLYIGAMMDVTEEPVILEFPAFDSVYVSLMVTGYDHYVNVPLSTQNGDFAHPTRILFFSERTPGYEGQPVEGVDHLFEATGDYLSAVIRVMPHANEPDRLERNLTAMRSVKVIPLSRYEGKASVSNRFLAWESPLGIRSKLSRLRNEATFPETGTSDFDTFENNLLEVMQFVFNHTTFDPDDPVDKAVLATYEPLGVVPGREFDPDSVADIDGEEIRVVAERFARNELARATDPEFQPNMLKLFKTKGEISEDLLAFQSVMGPIGLPATEALYPAIATADGHPMNATNDYIIRMSSDELPPAKAFWSITLYDIENGFFIPNAAKKYSVGLNGGMELDADGGITIAIAAEKPEGIADDNWLPIERGDTDIGPVMRIYAPDIEKFAIWKTPVAEKAN
ncbi:DUF1214 domain-containing protein [Roseibium aggregatum]|uniref:DUF1214 domain-containing protein n=1 Tax=Roseibium aggregatum TaxID=187304 RepID=UPI003A96A866